MRTTTTTTVRHSYAPTFLVAAIVFQRALSPLHRLALGHLIGAGNGALVLSPTDLSLSRVEEAADFVTAAKAGAKAAPKVLGSARGALIKIN